MDSQPFTKFLDTNSNNSSSWKDPDVIDITPSAGSQGLRSLKRKHKQVVPFDIIQIDEDEDTSDLVIIGEKDGASSKNKGTVGHGTNWQNQIQDASAMDHVASYTNLGLAINTSWNSYKTGLGSQNLNYSNKFNSSFMDIDGFVGLAPQLNAIEQLPSISSFQKPDCLNSGMSSLTVPRQSNSCLQREGDECEIGNKFRLFKQFDTVHDHSDHYYNFPQNQCGRASYYSAAHNSNKASLHGVSMTNKAPKEWSKKVQKEWTILEKDLPESIFVRVYEERMDLLRAAIIGPAGTPYHDGVFFFDIFFPSNYPKNPPLVHYYSGGLRLNPNLYECGKVCLSLLNTWHGSESEKWTPTKSTILQVLLSIQALVLNAKPYFNEPGWAGMAGTPEGEKRSLSYNEQVFLLSCRTMLYTLQKPLKHFEDFVVGHFFLHAHSILEACKAYMEGAQVGCLVGGGVQDVDEGDKSCSLDFKHKLSELFPMLVKAFADTGADCQHFLNQSSKMDGWLKL